ncbi:MAG: NAD-dependent epimerase/dehydratase family protein [bacterium]|nr:NAD-dependent epimerase/dehydratase family protein [bacterium]
MKIVVIGGSGFLGSHVADRLSKQGHEVVVYDLTPSPYLRPDQKMETGDILDEKSMAQVVDGADVVYHFAGVADIGESAEQPVKTIQHNVMGTTFVLEACRLASVKRFVFSSSIYVYSNKGSFYRCSKQACEKIIQNYQEEFNLPFTILRFGSLYGPRANRFNIIRHYLEQALLEKKIHRKGDGSELREYIHVEDAAEASVRALDPRYENQFVIITGAHAMRVRDLLMMIREVMNNKIEIEFGPAEETDHYNITPYSYRPEKALRMMLDSYHDLGTGLLDLLYEFDAEIHAEAQPESRA